MKKICYNHIITTNKGGIIMNYGYVRVSSITQNIDRQMEEMHKWG